MSYKTCQNCKTPTETLTEAKHPVKGLIHMCDQCLAGIKGPKAAAKKSAAKKVAAPKKVAAKKTDTKKRK